MSELTRKNIDWSYDAGRASRSVPQFLDVIQELLNLRSSKARIEDVRRLSRKALDHCFNWLVLERVDRYDLVSGNEKELARLRERLQGMQDADTEGLNDQEKQKVDAEMVRTKALIKTEEENIAIGQKREVEARHSSRGQYLWVPGNTKFTNDELKYPESPKAKRRRVIQILDYYHWKAYEALKLPERGFPSNEWFEKLALLADEIKRELLGGSGLEAVENGGGSNDDQQLPALTKVECHVLQQLAAFDPQVLKTASQLVDPKDQNSYSERTVTPALRRLTEFGLAEYPFSNREGARLTINGRRTAKRIKDNDSDETAD